MRMRICALMIMITSTLVVIHDSSLAERAPRPRLPGAAGGAY